MEDGTMAWFLGGDGGGGLDRRGRAFALFNYARRRPLAYAWHATCPAASGRWARAEEAVSDRWGRSQIISN
jgi:hypothetical protein